MYLVFYRRSDYAVWEVNREVYNTERTASKVADYLLNLADYAETYVAKVDLP